MTSFYVFCEIKNILNILIGYVLLPVIISIYTKQDSLMYNTLFLSRNATSHWIQAIYYKPLKNQTWRFADIYTSLFDTHCMGSGGLSLFTYGDLNVYIGEGFEIKWS